MPAVMPVGTPLYAARMKLICDTDEAFAYAVRIFLYLFRYRTGLR